ncbi:MAG: WYL domain-containing protein [Eubacteriales bacterium]|nr:WYL domain-containing protein [Eubacteriales bacterium]
MAKSHNQKAKILFLAQMLRESGENRVLSMQDILAGLQEYGIQAERKSIYDDLEALRDFGMDVRFKRGRPGGYYLAGQTVPDRGESQNNSPKQEEAAPVQETMETEVHLEEKKPELTSGEKDYAAEPAGESEGVGRDWKFDRREPVGDKPMKLLCSTRLKKEVKDYFGKKAEYKDKGLGYFTVTAGQLGDAQFFGWLTAMGKDVHIVKPRKLAQAYRDYLKSLAKEYKGI